MNKKYLLIIILSFFIGCFGGQVSLDSNDENSLKTSAIKIFSEGDTKEALKYLNKALKINKKKAEDPSVLKSRAEIYMYIGMIFNAQGLFNEALIYYKKELMIKRKIGTKLEISQSISNVGLMYLIIKDFKRSLHYFQQALNLYKKKGTLNQYEIPKGSLSMIVINLIINRGRAYALLGKYKKALLDANLAIKYCKENNQIFYLAYCYQTLAWIYDAKGDYLSAVDNFLKAIKYSNTSVATANDLNKIYSTWYIGMEYWQYKNYKNAIYYLNQSIPLIEKLRASTFKSAKRDYFESLIGVYNLLISSYLKESQIEKSFNLVEQARAKSLVESLGKSINENVNFQGIENYQKNMDPKTAILSYASNNAVIYKGLALEKLPLNTINFLLTKNKLHGREILIKQFVQKNYHIYKKAIRSIVHKNRIKSIDNIANLQYRLHEDFNDIIKYYRYLISSISLTKKEKQNLKAISKELYKLLIKPYEKYIQNKKKIIIIPDGLLAFIPFETLIMPNGKFLIEKYHIKYTQSLTVSQIIAKRNYDSNRKSIIAFGGALYQNLKIKSNKINLKSRTFLFLYSYWVTNWVKEGKKIRDVYKSLGLSGWEYLPGSLKEVMRIKKIYPSAQIYTKQDVSEAKVKELSESGELSKYKILHFATHGLVVPTIPELSAIVLSQLKDDTSKEDGYLSMLEIANLKLKADFVNLSACETGLGKIFNGEGVVGLTQSFLIAGANGISASLWQVSDASTMLFMTRMYQLVNEENMNYDEAMTQVKREFIKTKKYKGVLKNPFFWAPFVYYGK